MQGCSAGLQCRVYSELRCKVRRQNKTSTDRGPNVDRASKCRQAVTQNVDHQPQALTGSHHSVDQRRQAVTQMSTTKQTIDRQSPQPSSAWSITGQGLATLLLAGKQSTIATGDQQQRFVDQITQILAVSCSCDRKHSCECNRALISTDAAEKPMDEQTTELVCHLQWGCSNHIIHEGTPVNSLATKLIVQLYTDSSREVVALLTTCAAPPWLHHCTTRLWATCYKASHNAIDAVLRAIRRSRDNWTARVTRGQSAPPPDEYRSQ